MKVWYLRGHFIFLLFFNEIKQISYLFYVSIYNVKLFSDIFTHFILYIVDFLYICKQKTIIMSKCILFSRVSTLNQSLEEQTSELFNEAHKNGYVDDDIVVIEYKESAISLALEERQGINKLMSTIESDSSIDCVICREISRLARRADVIYQIRNYLIEHRIQLIVCQPYMRLLDNDGKMTQTANIMFSLFGAISESEMTIKKERFEEGKHKARKEGRFCGGRVVFGYKLDKDKHILIDEEHAPLIRKIFHMYGNKKMSTVEIARELMSTGELWQETLSSAKTFISLSLRNNAYFGGCTYNNYVGKVNKQIVKYGYVYPAIISKELWNICTELRLINDSRSGSRQSKYIYFARNIVTYQGHKISPNSVTATYTCRYNCEEGGNFNINMVDSCLWYHCLQILKSQSGITKQTISDNLIRQIQLNTRKIHKLYQDVDKLKEEQDKVQLRIIKGKISESLGDKIIEDNEKEIYLKKREIYTLEDKNRTLDEQFSNNKTTKLDYAEIKDDEKRYELIHKYISYGDIKKVGICLYELDIDGTVYTINAHQLVRKIFYNGKEVNYEYLERFKRQKRK